MSIKQPITNALLALMACTHCRLTRLNAVNALTMQHAPVVITFQFSRVTGGKLTNLQQFINVLIKKHVLEAIILNAQGDTAVISARNVLNITAHGIRDSITISVNSVSMKRQIP